MKRDLVIRNAWMLITKIMYTLLTLHVSPSLVTMFILSRVVQYSVLFTVESISLLYHCSIVFPAGKGLTSWLSCM